MLYDFDRLIDRRNTDSSKWNYYPRDVLPLWTADMDFKVPEPVIHALQERVKHGIFGYAMEPADLREVICARMEALYSWRVHPAEIVFQPGVVLGFNRVLRAAAAPGDAILVQPPVYPPMLAAPVQNGMFRLENELSRNSAGHYEIDFVSLEETLTERTRVFLFCNPHNPVGRVYRRDELEELAAICLSRNLLICSDEIHCDLVFREARHVPIASLDPEIGRRSVTLMAPSKTFNIPGLHCSFAIVPDPELRKKLTHSESPNFPEVNALGFIAALAAYRAGEEWLHQALAYLESNRDLVVEFINTEMPGIRTGKPEATYLAWLDCRDSPIFRDPCRFFLEKAAVGLSDGVRFGKGGEGFIRLNFACPRSLLLQALGRMKAAFSDGEFR